MSIRRMLLLAGLALCAGGSVVAAQSLAERTKAMERRDGFVPMFWDAGAGKLYLELPAAGTELIYVVGLAAGIGSNDIGLDRAQLGGERVVRFDRVGPKVLMVEPNQRYRADSDNQFERRAVEESFASSVIWGFKVEAEENGRVLVDATDFVLRDAHGVIGSLQRSRQGSYRLDQARSAVYLPRTKGFPRNSEIEVTLTFAGENPGGWVRDVVPSPEAITVRQHHSFIALPDPGYVPRATDPRAGFFGISYADYATPISEPLQKQFIARHRLEKRNPEAAISDPVKPIVYYLDPGVPEPVRSALLDGARWWNQAFEAAGYRNAFQIEILPDSADPMDVRYNTITWIHRSTRGWSYGSSITDPRTGEILKGHVSLGSLRVRQDILIAEGLLSPFTGDERASTDAEAMALARIRQLSAHEVGHTLGIGHNYIASTQGRASVMDYPAPLVTLATDGRVDLTRAYAVGIGDWDKVAVTWGYQDFPDGTDEPAALEQILSASRARGLTFLTDQDARPTGSAHPETHLWDNGTDAAMELDRVMQVRARAMRLFGETAIRTGQPLALMEEAFVPLYLHHRYQVEAAVKLVAGTWYSYAMRGDGQLPLRVVPAADQTRALGSVLATITPAALAIPAAVLRTLPPRPTGYSSHRELFDRETGLVFDAITPAAGAADLVVGLLLDSERTARLVQQQALDPSLPGLDQVLRRLIGQTFGATPADGYHAELARTVQRVVVDQLTRLASEAGL
ncbi:MAG: zinc-dependent metalloprotease, partial [Gemmatimonadota bacterium]